MAPTHRTYEVPEANRVLPRVRRLVGQIAELSVQLPELQDELRIAEYLMRRPGASSDETDRFEQAAAALRSTEEDLAAAGFGGILAVGSGSARPPRLIELSYEPDGWQQHVVLVGKGITFDSGGLSLKPNDGMKLMKTDMAGGAVVIVVMSALASLGVRARVTGLVAAAENMPAHAAAVRR